MFLVRKQGIQSHWTCESYCGNCFKQVVLNSIFGISTYIFQDFYATKYKVTDNYYDGLLFFYEIQNRMCTYHHRKRKTLIKIDIYGDSIHFFGLFHLKRVAGKGWKYLSTPCCSIILIFQILGPIFSTRPYVFKWNY